MSIETDLGQQSTEGTALALATLVAGDPLSGAKLHLFKSSFTPLKSSVAADFIAVEADFTGYAPVALTYSSEARDSNGDPIVVTNRCFFQATDAVTPNTIGGCWIQNDVTGPPAVHTAVEWYEFAAPLTMTAALAFIAVTLGIQMPGTPGYAVVEH